MEQSSTNSSFLPLSFLPFSRELFPAIFFVEIYSNVHQELAIMEPASKRSTRQKIGVSPFFCAEIELTPIYSPSLAACDWSTMVRSPISLAGSTARSAPLYPSTYNFQLTVLLSSSYDDQLDQLDEQLSNMTRIKRSRRSAFLG